MAAGVDGGIVEPALPDLFAQSSLHILRPQSLDRLSTMLNPRKLLTTVEGLLRDYRGLAEAVGLSVGDLRRVEAAANPTREVISVWCRRGGEASVADLNAALAAIDRHDVAADCSSVLAEDCRAARSRGLDTVEKATRAVAAAGGDALTLPDLTAAAEVRPLPRYDAIILHSDDAEDETFAWHLADRLEKVGKKVFLPSRDVLAGTVEHSFSVEVLERRCDRALTVFSPAFLASPLNKLYADLAQYVGIQRQRAVVIPVMFKHCKQLPASLGMISKLKFDPTGGGMVNFYERLFRTFDVDNAPKHLLEYPHVERDTLRIRPLVLTSESISSDQLATTVSEMDTVVTTVSEMSVDSQTKLLAKSLPNVPSHEPSDLDYQSEISPGNQQKSKKSTPFLTALKRRFKKSRPKAIED